MEKMIAVHRKLLSLFVVLALVLTAAPMTLAEETGSSAEGMQTPVRGDVQVTQEENSGEITASGRALANTEQEIQVAVGQIAEKLIARSETFQIQISMSAAGSDIAEFGMALLEGALAHDGTPTGGDYLFWHMESYGLRAGWSGNDITYTYSVTYRSTAAQEEALDAAVDALLAQLDLDGKSDHEKVCAVYDYMTENIYYDHDGLFDDSDQTKYTAYGALVEGSAVCQGYASLFYRLMLELGIDARVVAGTGNGGGHGWNIVELGGVFYNVDATWDASYAQEAFPYEYFLKCEDHFDDHFRDGEYETDSFEAAYPMAQRCFSEKDHNHRYSVQVTEAPTASAEGKLCAVCTVYGESLTVSLPKLTEADYTLADGKYTWKNERYGEITFNAPETHRPGDINGDGNVNNKDVTRLFQYLSNYDVETVAEALDVNDDGNVNNKDLTRLFQFVSGYDVEIH